MSILDFTTGLFRDPVNLRSFVDDPDQALTDAGLPDAKPEQVHDLLPVIAESMPPDHPLQTVAHSADHYPDPPQDDEPHHDHALDHGGVDLDISGVAWGQAVE
ncbi:MAG TPA: IniB N-terminal domain-containing protein [Mycobacterium sp.]|jgi:hypothetical protein|nr:IniB N-terminal domain-containing protein [Mycobacterium sp.]